MTILRDLFSSCLGLSTKSRSNTKHDDNEKLLTSDQYQYQYQYFDKEKYHDGEFHSDQNVKVNADDKNKNNNNNNADDYLIYNINKDDQDKDENVNQAADEIITAFVSATETVAGPELQRTVDDIVVAYQSKAGIATTDKNKNKNNGGDHINKSRSRNRSRNSEIENEIEIQNKITRKWIRALARAVLHRLEKTVGRVLKAINDDNNDNHHQDMPKMGRAMRFAFNRALEEAKITLKSWEHLPHDHPVWCALIVLGMLVSLAPWVLEALGFTEVGILEGMYNGFTFIFSFFFFFFFSKKKKG